MKHNGVCEYMDIIFSLKRYRVAMYFINTYFYTYFNTYLYFDTMYFNNDISDSQ